MPVWMWVVICLAGLVIGFRLGRASGTVGDALASVEPSRGQDQEVADLVVAARAAVGALDEAGLAGVRGSLAAALLPWPGPPNGW